MSHVKSTDDTVHIFQTLTSEYEKRCNSRPWVTLTWAQSLDGKLSTSGTAQTIISGTSSMQMTHGLRALHDSILVGSNTIMVDDPRLTTRLSSNIEAILEPMLSTFGKSSIHSPVPVILDSRLRTKHSARCLQQQQRKTPSKPFIFCANGACDINNTELLKSLANIVTVSPRNVGQKNAHLPLNQILQKLTESNVTSVMVEGGTSVLSSFFADDLWDIAIVTVAPAIFGAGPALHEPPHAPASFTNLRFARSQWYQLGDDVVLVGFPDRKCTD